MKMRVELFGALRQRFPDYSHQQGIEVEIPDGATAKDLLSPLKISESDGAVVIVEGRILKTDEPIPMGTHAKVFQTLQGG